MTDKVDVPNVKRKRGRPPSKPPAIDVIERSVQTDWEKIVEEATRRREHDPFGATSQPIHLKDPRLVPHWFNKDKYPDAIVRHKRDGWRPVLMSDVVDTDELGEHSLSVDGFIVRGERGNEILMCMPEEYVKRIAMAKQRENIRRMGNPNATRAEVIEAYGKKNPDNA